MNQVRTFLSSLYRNETITLILEEAINGRYQITFTIHESGMTYKSGEERTLSKGNLSIIRSVGFEKKAPIEIEPYSIVQGAGSQLYKRGKNQDVGYCDLRVDDNTLEQIKKQFGNGDKGLKIGNLELRIAPLTSKEIEDRTQEIKLYSLEERGKAKLLEQRGYKLYAELKKNYPKVTFNKEDVAQFIQDEEKLIYQSLKKDVPSVSSYIKHTRKPSKSVERSMS